MKKLLFTLMALLAIVPTASAQRKMNVKLFDGTVYKLRTTDIEEIQFEDDDSDEPKVPYTHAVDLGLSVKWADMNVGAEKPEDYGSYFAWGETMEKATYDWSTYRWCSNGGWTGMTKYTYPDGISNGIWYDGYRFVGDNKTVLDPEDDAATANWGGEWRMPTKAEQDELRSKCTWTWTTQNGVYGWKVTGSNGNSIFLPAAGYRFDSSLYDAGSYGNYWFSLLNESNSCRAGGVHFDSSNVYRGNNSRDCGFSVRPVCTE